MIAKPPEQVYAWVTEADRVKQWVKMDSDLAMLNRLAEAD